MSFTDATEILINDKLRKNYTPDSWQAFRDEQLWTLDVNDCLTANLTNLTKVFNSYLEPVKKQLLMTDVTNFIMKDVPENNPACAKGLGIAEKDVVWCYSMSKMTVVKEHNDYKKYQQMVLVEFLEFIGRLADCKFKK